MTKRRPPVAVVLKGYPRLSETFIAQELRGLELAGQPLLLISMRHPTDKARHPVHDEIEAPVSYLPEYLYREPFRVLRAWWGVRRRENYRAVRNLFLRHLLKDFTPNRARRFGQGLVLAFELPEEVRRIHAHFLHTPASVADYAAQLTGGAWSYSAHAKDIWQTGEWEKREKLSRALWGVTCTRFGYEHLAGLMPPGRKDDIELAYHGLDLERFPPPPGRDGPARDGSDSAKPVIIASVGRAVPKKGYDIVLKALALLPAELAWEFRHVGGGQLAADLKAQGRQLGIAGRITWLGARPQGEIIACLRGADIFVLASRIAADGDRDGLPNVLMEAQSQALPCVATDVAGIPEFLIDGETGLLVPPEDPGALASALARAIGDPGLRHRLGAAGYRRLVDEFSFERCFAKLKRRFGLAAEADKTATE
ncbi:Glycosyl transferase, group 1 family protein [hydrothermal vent metagenome]|uniref:Glycosyl transferase, group 1 family protein n=1 Tax=hydrothermal vent metagenome TaxID=652676 RepID=A0A3B0TZW3_9ZZZZ